MAMRNYPKYQQGGPLDFLGTNIFADLFPENTYDFSVSQDFTVPDAEVHRIYQDYRTDNTSAFGRMFGAGRKKARRYAEKEAERLANDPVYQQSVLRERNQNKLNEYLESDFFQDGLQGVMGQFQSIQDQEAAESRMNPIEIDQYTVGPDQGFFQSFQKGGLTGMNKLAQAAHIPNQFQLPSQIANTIVYSGRKIGQSMLDMFMSDDPTGYTYPIKDIKYSDTPSGDPEPFIRDVPITEGMLRAYRINKQHGAQGFPEEILPYLEEADKAYKKQYGGEIKTSKQGYRDGSPDENEPAVKILGNRISMDGVSRSLFLVPDNGEPKLAEPNSGTHYFPGATEVVEYPVDPESFANGGFMIANNQPMNSPLQMRTMLMQMGGEIMEPVPVQLEKGEEVIFQDNTIVKPKANKRHSQMKDGQYTDVLPPGTYIASRDRSQVIDRDRADNMVVSSMGPFSYSENEIIPHSEQKTLGQLFKKKKQTPAEIARGIRSKFPVVDQEDDVFAMETGNMNLQSRTPYVNALVQLAEATKMPEEGMMKYGGYAEKKQLGGLIGGIGQLFSAGIQAAQAQAAANRVERNMNASLRDIDDFEDSALNRTNVGGAIGAASVAAQFASQDTDYSYLDLDPLRTRTQNAFTAAGQNIQLQDRLADEVQQAPLSMVAKYSSFGDPRMGQQAYNAAYSEYLSRANDRKLNLIPMQTELELGAAESLNQIDRAEIMDRQQGEMYERATQNTLNQGLFQGLGTVGQNVLQNQDRIQGAALGSRMSARGQATSAINNISQVYSDSVSRAFTGLQDIYNSFANNNNQSANQAGNINFDANDPMYGRTPSNIYQFDGQFYPNYRWDENLGRYVYTG